MSFGITPARFRNQSAYNLFAVLAITYLTSAFHLSRRQRRLDNRHVTNFYQSDSSLNMLMADPENFPKARVVAVFFGFPWFVFNELSWNPSQ